tara:strand:+ start:291 stop:509 length:219 start_codon:yes stop_codon:yes gene_type:complete
MSAEKKLHSRISDLTPFVIHEKNVEVSLSGRVDINILLNRARKEQKKKVLINLVFIGVTSCLIIVAGIILSF